MLINYFSLLFIYLFILDMIKYMYPEGQNLPENDLFDGQLNLNNIKPDPDTEMVPEELGSFNYIKSEKEEPVTSVPTQTPTSSAASVKVISPSLPKSDETTNHPSDVFMNINDETIMKLNASLFANQRKEDKPQPTAMEVTLTAVAPAVVNTMSICQPQQAVQPMIISQSPLQAVTVTSSTQHPIVSLASTPSLASSQVSTHQIIFSLSFIVRDCYYFSYKFCLLHLFSLSLS